MKKGHQKEAEEKDHQVYPELPLWGEGSGLSAGRNQIYGALPRLWSTNVLQQPVIAGATSLWRGAMPSPPGAETLQGGLHYLVRQMQGSVLHLQARGDCIAMRGRWLRIVVNDIGIDIEGYDAQRLAADSNAKKSCFRLRENQQSV